MCEYLSEKERVAFAKGVRGHTEVQRSRTVRDRELPAATGDGGTRRCIVGARGGRGAQRALMAEHVGARYAM
jgi:hypothetical protein